MKKSEADKAALAEKLANVMNTECDDETMSDPEDAPTSTKKKKIEPKILRPVGQFNIQEAMGLTGSKKKRDQYMAIAVCLHVLSLFLIWLMLDCVVSALSRSSLAMPALIGSLNRHESLCGTRPSFLRW